MKKNLNALLCFILLVFCFSGCSQIADVIGGSDFFNKEPSKGALKVLINVPVTEELPITTEGVTVMFDRPMVPLATLDAGREKIPPLSIEPFVQGKYYWLGTKGFIYRFKEPLKTSTTYRVKLPKGVMALDGFKLEKPVEWSFSTSRPKLWRWMPSEGELSPQKAVIEMHFNVAMRKSDVEKNIFIVKSSTNQPFTAKKTMEWDENDHVLRIHFDETLPWNESLAVRLPAGILGRDGTLGMAKEQDHVFTTPAAKAKVEKVFYYGEEYNQIDIVPEQKMLLNTGTGICFKFSQAIDSSTFEKAFHSDGVKNLKEKPFFYFKEYDSLYFKSADGDSHYLEGYRIGCVALLEEFNTLYKFSLDAPQIKTLSGSTMSPHKGRYIIRSRHAEPDLNSKLTRNILSQKGSLKIPYKAINVKNVTVNLYRLSNKSQYSESIQNLKGLYPQREFNAVTKTYTEITPHVSEVLVGSDLQVPLRSDANIIDPLRMPPMATLGIPVSEEMNKDTRFFVNLDDFSGEANLAPGFYLIEMIPNALMSDAVMPNAVYSMVHVTAVALAVKREVDQVLAWATDIETGQPIDALPLNVTYVHADGTVIEASGTTGTDGVAVVSGVWSDMEYDYSETVCVESTLPEHYSYSCQKDHGISGYRNVIDPGKNYFAYVYMDRPIYRPGQMVYFAAFVRRVQEGRYFVVDEGQKYSVDVTDASGENIYSREEVAEAGGVIHGNFELENREDLPQGNYNIRVRVGDEQYFSRAFFVQSYRKPSFKVEMKSAQSEISSGQKLEMMIQGTYFFGAPMKKAKTNWSIMTTTYDFNPENFSDYSFLDTDLLHKRTDEYDDYDSDYEYDYVAGYPVSEEESQWDDPRGAGVSRSSGDFFKNSLNQDESSLKGMLDDNGELLVQYVPNLKNYPFSQVLIVEANVKDPSYQEVSAADEVVVHKADYYIGSRPEKWVYGEKDRAVFDVVSLNTEGKLAAKRAFAAELYRRDYNYTKRRNARGYWEFIYEPQDILVEKKFATTDVNAVVKLDFMLPQGGTYRVVIKGEDDRGNSIQSASEIYAWGKGYVPWKLNESQDIELVPDKDSYQVGETAKILIKSLLPVSKALVTFERGRVLQYEVKELGGNATHIEIPITEGMIPNFYLDVIAHVGRDGNQPPLLYYGETELAVSPESKRLQIAIESDHPGTLDKPGVYSPGEKVAIKLSVKDSQGRPRKAHVMVSVADESVLRLLNYQLPDLVKKFYFRRPNQVSSSSSLLSFKAGDGSSDKKRRRIFQDTAHFEGHITTDENGMAEFRFKLPDDLTTWVIEALAVSDSKNAEAFQAELVAAVSSEATQSEKLKANLSLSDGTFVGGARGKIMATLPVVMRTALPRFVSWEDSVQGRVLLNNRNAKGVSGKLRLNVSEGTVFDGRERTIEIPFAIPAGEEKAFPVSFRIEGNPDAVVFSSEALSDGGEVIDSIEITIPAKDRLAAEVVASSGAVHNDKEIEQVDLSAESGINPKRGGLDVSFKASLGLAAADPMRRLIYYPWGCSEQKSSTLIAMLMARDLSLKFGEKYFDSLAPLSKKEIDGARNFEKKVALLDGKINLIIKDLNENYQSYWGGIRYWPESQNEDFFASTQVLWALTLARQQNFNVDKNFESSIQNFLWKKINEALPHLTYNDPFASWVIAKSGSILPYPAVMRALAKQDELSAEDISFLLLALAEAEQHGDQDEGINLLRQAKKPLMDKLLALSRQQARHTSWGSLKGDMMSSVKTTALAAHGLYRIEPDHPIPERALAYLLNRKKGKNHFFYSTQEDLYFAYFAYEYALRMGENKTDYEMSLVMGKNVLLKKRFNAANVLEEFHDTISIDKLISDKPLPITFDKNGDGTLYYDAVLKYYLPAGKAPPREEGLMVTRDYYSLKDKSEELPLDTFKVGEVYKGHITITVPQSMNYVMVQDMLPAGFEAVDLTLATTSRALVNLLEGETDRGSDGDVHYDDEYFVEDYGSDYGFAHQEIRDDSILWSDEYIPAGVYHLRYPVRATTAGTYLAPGAETFEFYEPEIFGRSKAMIVTVEPEK